MNILDIKYRQIRNSLQDTRLHNLLPTFSNPPNNPKRSLLLDIQSTKRPLGLTLRRPSTNHNATHHPTQAVTVNSARRTRIEQKQNAPPPLKPRRNMSFMQDDGTHKPTTKQFRVRHSHKQSDPSVKDFQEFLTEGAVTGRWRKVDLQHFEAEKVFFQNACAVEVDQHNGEVRLRDNSLVILHLEMFLNENSFWNPQKLQARIKTETRAVLSQMAHQYSIGFIHKNQSVLQDFIKRIEEWKIPFTCSFVINTARKNFKFFDLTHALKCLSVDISTNIIVIDLVEQTNPNSLQQQVSLPLCHQKLKLALILFKSSRKPGQLTFLPDLISLKQKSLHLKPQSSHPIPFQSLTNLQQLSHLLTKSKYLKAVTSLKRQSNTDCRTRSSIPTLEQSKDKLNKYMKIVQTQSLPQQRQNSVSYTVGDIVKKNYGIYNQITTNKYFCVAKYERLMTEIAALRVEEVGCGDGRYTGAVFVVNT